MGLLKGLSQIHTQYGYFLCITSQMPLIRKVTVLCQVTVFHLISCMFALNIKTYNEYIQTFISLLVSTLMDCRCDIIFNKKKKLKMSTFFRSIRSVPFSQRHKGQCKSSLAVLIAVSILTKNFLIATSSL